MARLRRFGLRLAKVAAAIFLLWGAGLAWFVLSSLFMRADPSGTTDAIVVVTGGRLRLEAGLELFAPRKAKKPFISRVHRPRDRHDCRRAYCPLPAPSGAVVRSTGLGRAIVSQLR